MINSGLIFEYASQYCAIHPKPVDLKNFKLSDGEYDKFLAFLKENKFTYATPLERNTKQLIESAKQERYYTELEAQLNNLKNTIETSKSTDLKRFKSEIAMILEENIAFDYELNEGQADISLHRDKAVLEARKILNDPVTYKKILAPQ